MNGSGILKSTLKKKKEKKETHYFSFTAYMHTLKIISNRQLMLIILS